VDTGPQVVRADGKNCAAMKTWESWKMAPSAPDAENAAPRQGPAVLASLGLSAEQVHRALTGKPMPERLKAMAAAPPPPPKFRKGDITPELRKRLKEMKRKGHTNREICMFTKLPVNWVSRILLGKV
jgi:hypothetical protein